MGVQSEPIGIELGGKRKVGGMNATTRRVSLLMLGLIVGLGALVAANVAVAAQPPVFLGTVSSFAVLSGQGVTNTGPSVINGDLGTWPNPAITGFPPGLVNGATHAADAVAQQAQSDLTVAYNDTVGRVPFTNVGVQLGGTTQLPGVYRSPTFQITGQLRLDAQGDPNAVFIFQTGPGGSTLITAANSSVLLINGAQACNVFWQVASSATLGTASSFIGNIFALTSISAGTGATVQGRLLARNGAVTLDTNTITRPACAPGTIGGPGGPPIPNPNAPVTTVTPVTNPFGGLGGPGGVSVAIGAGALPGGSIPGLNRGPTGGDEGPIPADNPNRRRHREQDVPETPAIPAPSPATTPPAAPPVYGVGSSFLAPTPAAPPSRSQGPPSLAHTD